GWVLINPPGPAPTLHPRVNSDFGTWNYIRQRCLRLGPRCTYREPEQNEEEGVIPQVRQRKLEGPSTYAARAAQKRLSHRRRRRYCAQRTWTPGRGQIAGDAPPLASAAS